MICRGILYNRITEANAKSLNVKTNVPGNLAYSINLFACGHQNVPKLFIKLFACWTELL
jgi:hypothetical protein